jgi:putative transport protein
MQWLVQSLRQHPEIAIFLVVGIGYGLGNLKIGKFSIGPVLGVLIAGIVVGQLDIPVSETLKNLFFMLFLFAVGYQTGPQFFSNLKTTGFHQIVLTLVICGVALILSVFVARLMEFDAGMAGGLLAGAMTGPAAFGAAGAAIDGLQVSAVTRQTLMTGSAVSFAVCYLVGTVLLIWLLTKVGPWLMRVDLAESCRKLEEEMGIPQEGSDVVSAKTPFVARAYEVTEQFVGKSVGELESEFVGYRVFVENLERDGVITKPDTEDLLSEGDRVALLGRREALVGPGNALRHNEINDGNLLDIGLVSQDIIVGITKDGLTLGELGPSEIARGIFLQKMVRAGKELPYTLQTPIEAGDVLTVVGGKFNIERLAEELGYAQIQSDATNLTGVSLAIFLGALIGLPALALRSMEISLTIFVGVLLGGLALGLLASLYPRLGGIPKPALWLFDSLGLAGFLALVGIQAGPGFVRVLQQSGFALMGSAVIVVIAAQVIGILIGRYVLGMHPGIVLGACAGAGTSPTALGAVLEAANSRVPALSYGITYALGNVILALGGSLIVKVIGAG